MPRFDYAPEVSGGKNRMGKLTPRRTGTEYPVLANTEEDTQKGAWSKKGSEIEGASVAVAPETEDMIRMQQAEAVNTEIAAREREAPIEALEGSPERLVEEPTIEAEKQVASVRSLFTRGISRIGTGLGRLNAKIKEDLYTAFGGTKAGYEKVSEPKMEYDAESFAFKASEPGILGVLYEEARGTKKRLEDFADIIASPVVEPVRGIAQKIKERKTSKAELARVPEEIPRIEGLISDDQAAFDALYAENLGGEVHEFLKKLGKEGGMTVLSPILAAPEIARSFVEGARDWWQNLTSTEALKSTPLYRRIAGAVDVGRKNLAESGAQVKRERVFEQAQNETEGFFDRIGSLNARTIRTKNRFVDAIDAARNAFSGAMAKKEVVGRTSPEIEHLKQSLKVHMLFEDFFAAQNSEERTALAQKIIDFSQKKKSA